MKIKKKPRVIDPEYRFCIYGYNMMDYKNLGDLNELYLQLEHKPLKIKNSLIKAIKRRAIVLTRQANKQMIKNIFKNN